jgi:hypothetical protein
MITCPVRASLLVSPRLQAPRTIVVQHRSVAFPPRSQPDGDNHSVVEKQRAVSLLKKKQRWFPYSASQPAGVITVVEKQCAVSMSKKRQRWFPNANRMQHQHDRTHKISSSDRCGKANVEKLSAVSMLKKHRWFAMRSTFQLENRHQIDQREFLRINGQKYKVVKAQKRRALSCSGRIVVCFNALRLGVSAGPKSS